MGYYKDEVNVVPHNFNNTTLLINGTHKAVGLEMVEVDRDNDEVSAQFVADGLGILNESPVKVGRFAFQVLEALPTTDVMWELYESKARFSLSLTDSASPNLNCNGKYFLIMKPPTVKRGKEGEVTEWVCLTVFLNLKGGSYRLETV